MNRVNEQPLRRLDDMNEQQAYRFLAEPFEAPQWRALWVARMGTGAPPRDTRLGLREVLAGSGPSTVQPGETVAITHATRIG